MNHPKTGWKINPLAIMTSEIILRSILEILSPDALKKLCMDIDDSGSIRLKVNDVENPPYSVKTMGDLLMKYSGAMTAIAEALKDEADFFSANGDGSPG